MKLSQLLAQSLLFSALILALLPFNGQAQTTNASIVGTITDPSGSALPNVTVNITNTETNALRAVTTDGEGNYNVTNLPIGSYKVTAELAGFKRAALSAVQLVVNQTARLDVKLEVGDISEQINVEAETPLIESERSEVAQVIENKTIVQLPLNGRNFIRLGSLIPGTTEGAPGNSIVRDRQGGVAFTSNGQRAEHNNFTLDGVDNNETLFGVAVVVPSVDAIQEFKVQTANYSAEFGRGAGAIVNVAIKNGTNDLRGSVYEFVRNDKFDARNPFSPVKNPLRRNQYGFAVGGPVFLPRFGEGTPPLLDLRNRTFFFFNYEALKLRSGFTTFTNVPTATQRSGNFGATRITDPATGLPCNATVQTGCFPNNQIPANRISPITQRLLALYPLPNSTDVRGNYLFSGSNPTDNDQINIRGDHRFTDNDTIFGRYSQTNSDAIGRAVLNNSTTTTIATKGAAGGYTKVFSSSLINDLRLGFQRFEFSQLPEGYGTEHVTEFGLPNFATDASYYRYPTVSVTGFATFGGPSNIPLIRTEDSYQAIDTVSLTLGKHALRMGGDVRRYLATNFQPQQTAGDYIFSGAVTGNAVADFLLGRPSQQRILNTTGFDAARPQNTRFTLFVQDDYQVSQRLTVNLGLRYEYDGKWTEANDRFAYFDFNTGETVYPNGLPAALRTALEGFRAANAANTSAFRFRFDDLNAIRPAQTKQFAPRVGFAFRPFSDGKTVVRAAFGVFWGQPIANVILNTAATPPPFSLTQNVTGSNLQFGVFPLVTGSSLIATQPSYFTIQPNLYKNSYVQQWNAGIERDIGFNTAIKISYVGSRGTHLERRYEGNPALPSATTITNARRRFPTYGTIQLQESTANSSYHSLQVSAEKRFSDGLLFLAGYTYSKSLDDVSSWTGLGSQESPFPQNSFNLRAERGRSGYDLRHRFTLSAVYELPFRSDNKALDLLVGGYQVSGILTLRTGYPFNVFLSNTDTSNTSGTATANSRLNVIGDPFANVAAGFYFNPAAFARPAAGTFGSAGRNFLSGPNARQLDFSVMKVFRFNEARAIQLRAEAFNVFNHPTFDLPIGDFTSPSFGRIVSSDNRNLQFAIKFLF